jgi:predicted Zn finger-like uncharacterized protein
MPEQVRCPSCNAALRVPENLLGKNVKCPKCQKTFLAEMGELDELEEVVDEPAPRARRRPQPPDDEEELPPDEEFEEENEDRPRRRRRGGRRRAEAEAKVAGPAIALIVLGIFDLVLVVLGLLLRLLGVGLMAAGAAGHAVNANTIAHLAGGTVGTIIGTVCAVAILMGGLKMKKLENYGSVMTACILAILPFGNCCCIGLPLGIWGLVVLNKPGVKDAFR